MRAVINLENAENIIKALKRMEDIHGKPFCPSKPNELEDSNICPCFNIRLNDKCCCGLFKFEE